jgi:hypothetical protein
MLEVGSCLLAGQARNLEKGKWKINLMFLKITNPLKLLL